jgi:hypothetical protein
MKNLYFCGKYLLKEFDKFAYPRTGSHYFEYVLGGLFDVVGRVHPHLKNGEAIDRQNELEPLSLYALDLREDGVPFQPIYLNSLATGMHGLPKKGESPIILLIRDPLPVVFSLYQTARDRWGLEVKDLGQWVHERLTEYVGFYSLGFDVLDQHPEEALLVRWEDLTASSQSLYRLVDFVNVRPKLSCEFVHHITQFHVFAKPGKNTFYRSGSNSAWKADSAWGDMLRSQSDIDFRRFGYRTLKEQIEDQTPQTNSE